MVEQDIWEAEDNKVRVYIAASSDEVDRVERWTYELSKKGNVVVVSTWVDDVKRSGGGNPENATDEEREGWADDCEAGVENADLVWVLMPRKSSMGAFYEFALARAYKLVTCISGENQHASVFATKAKYRFNTDEEAFSYISNATMTQLYGEPS